MFQAVPAKLTYQLSRALGYAGVEAAENGSQVIEPEHLLLGLLQDDHSQACIALRETGQSPAVIRRSIELLLDAEPSQEDGQGASIPHDAVQLSDATKNILRQAAVICAKQKQRHVGPQHALLALQKDPTKAIATIWRTHEIILVQEEHRAGASLEKRATGDSHWHEREYPAPEYSKERGEWSRYTEKAKYVIAYGQHEAAHLGHSLVSPLLLLTGMLRSERTVAEDILQRCGADRVSLCEAIIDLLDFAGPPIHRTEDMKLDADSAKIMAQVHKYRIQFGDRHTGTEHILLALLTDKGSAGNFLRQHGVTTASALAQMRKVKRRNSVARWQPDDPIATRVAWTIFVLVLLGFIYFLCFATP